MKKILVLFCLLFVVLITWAQLKEGTVLYERTIQLQFRRQNLPPEMAAEMPRSRTDRFELSFANQQALWESLPDMEENNENEGMAGGSNRVTMRFGGDDHIYYNFETGKRVELRELRSKNYIIEDSIRKLNWKLSEETKTILGYTTRKATTQRTGTRTVMTMENGEMKRQQMADTTNIIAWFTTEIPVPAGPEFGGQLPGLILELDMNNGRTVYIAKELSPKVTIAHIKEPKGGNRISPEEFAKEQRKMMEEMRQNMPPGRTVRIIGE